MSIINLHLRFREYKTVFENLSPNTIIWHKRIFNSFISFTAVSTISEVNKQIIENWIIWGKTEREWSPKTIKSSISSLGVFLNWCVKENIIAENPAQKIPKPRLPKRIPKHLSIEQSNHLLDWAKLYPYLYPHEKHRAVAIIAMFMYSGVRYKELINLKLTDVDFTHKVITVSLGKGAKDRMIPLCESLEGYLFPYVQERATLNPYSIYFFVSLRTHGKMSDNVIKRLFAKLQKKSKLKFHPHMLRHTFATLMLEGGCDIFSLSKMMGHSDIKTTAIYLSATVKHLQGQMRKHPLQ